MSNNVELSEHKVLSQTELVKVLYKAVDGHSTIDAISAYFAARGEHKNRAVCQSLNKEVKKIRKDALISLCNELRGMLPLGPDKDLILSRAASIGFRLSKPELKEVHSQLKNFPELWEKEKPQNWTITLPASDLAIIRMFETISGETTQSILKIALRTMLIAAGQRQIDMMEAFESAKNLSEHKKNQYIRLLSNFNLRKP